MSRFDELMEETKAELVALAEEFELDATGNKPDLAERIVAFETGAPVAEPDEEPEEEIEEPAEEPVEEPVAETPDDTVLVRFVGANSLYQVRGKSFTKDNPFQAVSKSDADYLLKNQSERFRTASTDEVQDFYS